jgi:hypothetical protein
MNGWNYVYSNPILSDHSGNDVDCSPLDFTCLAEKARDEGFYKDAARFSEPWEGPAREPHSGAFARAVYQKYQEVLLLSNN